MTLQASVFKLTTGESISYWGGAFAENGLFILLETKEIENQSAAATGPEILDLVLTSYTNFSVPNLSSIAQILSTLSDRKEVVSLIIGAQSGKQLFLGANGEGEVLMIRDNRVGKILTKNEVSSGEIKAGDIVIFCPTFLETLYSYDTFRSLFPADKPFELEQRIKSDITSLPQAKGVTLLTCQFSSQIREMKIPKFSPVLFQVKIENMVKTAKTALHNFFKRNKDDQNNATVPDIQAIRSKRVLLTISFILVLLLTGSVFLNINRTRDREKQKKLADALVLISHQFDEAGSLIDLSPIRARSLLTESKLALSPFLTQFSKNSPEYKQVGEWLGKIGQKEIEAYKIYKLTSVPLFFDITFLKSNGVASKMTSYQTTKAILDIPNKVVYKLNTKTKESEIVAGSDIVKDGRSVAIHGKTVDVLTSDGVVEIDLTSKTSKIAIKKDEEWGELVSVAVFGGNVYLLDRSKNTIWKYIATDFGFSQKITYLNPGVRVNFSDTMDMTIDGSVWTLSGTGISKYSKGINDQFVISGFSDSISGLVAFSTDESDKYIYALDQLLSRIVVFDKDGIYQSQYQWDELKNATDIIASESEKKIFVAIGSKIYAIDIK